MNKIFLSKRSWLLCTIKIPMLCFIIYSTQSAAAAVAVEVAGSSPCYYAFDVSAAAGASHPRPVNTLNASIIISAGSIAAVSMPRRCCAAKDAGSCLPFILLFRTRLLKQQRLHNGAAFVVPVATCCAHFCWLLLFRCKPFCFCTLSFCYCFRH